MNKLYKKLLVAFIILLLLFYIIKIKVIGEVFDLIFISFIISYTLKPIHKKLTEKGINRKLAAILLIFLGVFLIILALFMLIPNIIKESLTINKTILELRKYIDFIYKKTESLNHDKTLYPFMNHIFVKANLILSKTIGTYLDKIIKFSENALSVVVIPVIVYYLIAENEKITNSLLVFIPVRCRSIFKNICKDIDKVLSRYITSQFLLSIIIFVLTFIVLLIFRVDYPILLSLINGLFNIIPYFGPLIGAIPAIAIAFLKSPQTAIYTAISLQIIQQLEGDVISPKITGDRVNIHPLVVILLLIVGGKLGGFIGMVLAIPIGVIIKVIYEDINYYIY